MGAKDKRQQLIKEILQSGGALDSSAIKERVCARLNIDTDDYPKATFLRHLKELVDENQITLENNYGKNLYHLPDEGWDVLGQKYIENLGHRLFVPKMIRTAGVRVLPGFQPSREDSEVAIVMELGQTFFTLYVHKDALPFNLHISRTQLEYDKPKLITQYGSRIIFLEAMIRKVSGYKEDNQKKNGHVVLVFSQDGILSIEDLGSTHGTFVVNLSTEDCERLQRVANESSRSTSRHNEEDSKTLAKKIYLPLPEFTLKNFGFPVSLKCSDELTLSILS